MEKNIIELLSDLFWDCDRISENGNDTLKKIENMIKYSRSEISTKNMIIRDLLTNLEYDYDRMSSSGQLVLKMLYKEFGIDIQDKLDLDAENYRFCIECKTYFRKDIEIGWMNDAWCLKMHKFICNDCLEEIENEAKNNMN